MRIAVVNWTNRQVGGPERYLHDVLAPLRARGHDLLFWCETDTPTTRDPIDTGGGLGVCAATLGADAARRALADWRPDVVYAHGMLDPALEAAVMCTAPAVFFPHGHYGTCISGGKSFTWPTTRPCHRRFGPACLALYYPRRTGGRNPIRMVREYRRQSARLRLMRRYTLLVTNSAYLRREYLRHGVSSARIRTITYYVRPPAAADPASPRGPGHGLVYVGRMDPLKGGDVLLDALPAVVAALGDTQVTFVGDGPARAAWERRATALAHRCRGIRVTFTGWLASAAVEDAIRGAHLLVLPSLVPEAFARVGPEAGYHGVPAAAFDVGGIGEWLTDGVNGALAPGDPPRPAALADAIVRCLTDDRRYRALRDGARRTAERFSLARHLDELERALSDAATQ